MIFFNRINKTKALKHYIDMLNEEINKDLIFIHSIEKNKHNVTHLTEKLVHDIQFIKGKVQERNQVVNDLEWILHGKANSLDTNIRIKL